MERDDAIFWMALVLLTGLAFLGWRFSSKIQRIWLRRSIRVVPVSLWVMALGLLGFGFVFWTFDKSLYADEDFLAPDHRHTARLRYVTPGALGSDTVIVQVRKSWFEDWQTVNLWYGSKDDMNVTVRWLDSRSLLVRGPGVETSQATSRDRQNKDRCGQDVTGIRVVCEGY